MTDIPLKFRVESVDKLFVVSPKLTLDLMTDNGMATLEMSPALAEQMAGLVIDGLLSLKNGQIPPEGALLALADVSIRDLAQTKSGLQLARQYELTASSVGGTQFRWRISQEKAEALARNILGSRALGH